MSGEPEVRLVGEAELGVEEHPLQQMDRERSRIDHERRCIAQLRQDLEDRAKRLREFEDRVLGSGSCRSHETQTSLRTAETQTSASEKTRASEMEAERVQDKIETAQTALIVALGGGRASEVADCAHRATLQALEKTHQLLVVARTLNNKCIDKCVKNVVQAYDHIDELIKFVGRRQALKVWEKHAEHAEKARRDIRDALVLHCRSQAADPSRGAFLEAAGRVFGRPLDRDLRAVLLLAYHKVSKDLPIASTFLSNTQLATARRGRPRPRRQRVIGEFLSCGHRKDDLRHLCAVCRQHYDDVDFTRSQEDDGGDAATSGASSSQDGPHSVPQHPPSDFKTLNCPQQKRRPRFEPRLCSVIEEPTATTASSADVSDSRGEVARSTGTEGRLLVCCELNGVLVWRDYSDGSGLMRYETFRTESGKMVKTFIRPGAGDLVASLLREPRCDFAIFSAMQQEKYCVPIAELLLKRACPEGEWVLKRDGVAYWALTTDPHTRVYVFGQAKDETHAKDKCIMKSLDRVWKTLHERGYGWYSKHNTVLLDTVSHSASHPDNVCVVPRWRPPAEGADDPNPIDLMELEHPLLAQHIGVERSTVCLGNGARALPPSGEPCFIEIAASLGAHPVNAEPADEWEVHRCVADRQEADEEICEFWKDLLSHEQFVMGIDVKYHDGQVSVVSLASTQCTVILDALTFGDAMHQLLQPLFEHPGVSKVFHGEVDHVAWLAFRYGLLANNIFRTSDISLYYGDGRYPSLRTLCQNYLGFELETTSLQADWWERPLPAHIIRCAANEVAALVPLYHAMLAAFHSEWRASCFEGEL